MTANARRLQLLKEALRLMHRAAKVLEKSFEECQQISGKKEYSEAQMGALELLSTRFSRLADFLIRRIFRLIDELDLEQPGPILDIINRAEKKGLIAEADAFIEIWMLRNKISHEYVEEVMAKIFREVVRLVPSLLDAVRRVDDYASRYG